MTSRTYPCTSGSSGGGDGEVNIRGALCVVVVVVLKKRIQMSVFIVIQLIIVWYSRFPTRNESKPSIVNQKSDKVRLKVRNFQNEFIKSSFLPKYEPNIIRISATYYATLQGRNPNNFWFIFWNKR